MSRGLLLAALAACAFWPPALAQEPPAPARVGTPGVAQPRLIREVTPVYPEIARSARVEGVVLLEATIDASGRVSDARVTRSIKLLDETARVAVLQWEFAPPLINGQTGTVVTTVALEFRLRASAPAPPDTATTSPSGMPADFAIFYSVSCGPGARTAVLTSRTHDLGDIHRAMSVAGLLSGGESLTSWRDPSLTTVLGNRVEVVVTAAPVGTCPNTGVGLDPLSYLLAVRAEGTWTQLWPPEKRDLHTPEYDQRLSTVRNLIQQAIAGK